MKIAVAPADVKRIGIVGTGVIGCGWAAHFLAQGLDVIATDPHPEAEKRLRTGIGKYWSALEELGLADGASPDRLTFTASFEEALAEADFIQESTPEDESLKNQIMAAIEKASLPNVIIASSTSGFMPTKLQAPCQHPERVIVGHPFNPVYLMPLVEVVGGEKTAPEAIRWAMEFYQHWGKQPLHCRFEIEGHLANRLQASISREMMHLIADGKATTGELDAALTNGPGLRWALMGTWLTYALSSGDKDIREVLKQDIPTFQLPRSRLVAPEMTDILIGRIADGTHEQAAGRNIEELELMRDEFLVGLLKLRANIKTKYSLNY